MTNDELITHIDKSILFDDGEKENWSERVRSEGTTDQLVRELLTDIENRLPDLLAVSGAVDKNSDIYKQVLLDFHGELKKIAKEYKEEEEEIEQRALQEARTADVKEAQEHIAAAKIALAKE